jgi:hypothetical protein
MHFLIEHFAILGNSELDAVGVIAVFIFFIWKARDPF